jgi:hypothetical protein
MREWLAVAFSRTTEVSFEVLIECSLAQYRIERAERYASLCPVNITALVFADRSLIFNAA